MVRRANTRWEILDKEDAAIVSGEGGDASSIGRSHSLVWRLQAAMDEMRGTVHTARRCRQASSAKSGPGASAGGGEQGESGFKRVHATTTDKTAAKNLESQCGDDQRGSVAWAFGQRRIQSPKMAADWAAARRGKSTKPRDNAMEWRSVLVAGGASRPRAAPLTLALPVHNHARFLWEALPPLLAEAHVGTLELVLLDDGSTDDIEPWLVRALGLPNVRVLAGKLGSLPRALNGLASVSDPESAASSWTSADNSVYVGMYGDLLRSFAQPTSSELGLGYANFRAIDDDGNPHPTVGWWSGRYLGEGDSRLVYPETTEEMERTGENLVGPLFVVRSGAMRASLPYDTGIQGIEDFDMWQRVMGLAKAARLDDGGRFGYEYRVHAHTLTETLDKPQVHARLLEMRAAEPMRRMLLRQECVARPSGSARSLLRRLGLTPRPQAGAPAGTNPSASPWDSGEHGLRGHAGAHGPPSAPGGKRTSNVLGSVVEYVTVADLVSAEPLQDTPNGGLWSHIPALEQLRNERAAALPGRTPSKPPTTHRGAVATAGCMPDPGPAARGGSKGSAAPVGSCAWRVLVIDADARPAEQSAALNASLERVHAVWVPFTRSTLPSDHLLAVARARLYHRTVLDLPAAPSQALESMRAGARGRVLSDPRLSPVCAAANVRRVLVGLGQPTLPDSRPPLPYMPLPVRLAVAAAPGQGSRSQDLAGMVLSASHQQQQQQQQEQEHADGDTNAGAAAPETGMGTGGSEGDAEALALWCAGDGGTTTPAAGTDKGPSRIEGTVTLRPLRGSHTGKVPGSLGSLHTAAQVHVCAADLQDIFPEGRAAGGPPEAPSEPTRLRGYLSSPEGEAAAEEAALRRQSARVLVAGGDADGESGLAEGLPATAAGRRLCSAAAQADAVIVLSTTVASALDASGCVEPGLMVPGFEYARYGEVKEQLPRLVHITAAWVLQGAPVRSLSAWVRDDALFPAL